MNLRQARHKAKITQEELAKKSGVSRVTIARLEQGDQNTKMDTLTKLACALSCSVDELISTPPPDQTA